jgi:hypothetical protein
VIGKLVLAATPLVNHHWNIAFRLTPSGFETQPMVAQGHTFTAAFDFIRHELAFTCDDGRRAAIPLEPRTVADFHAIVMRTLDDMGIRIHIWTLPTELDDPIPFEKDTVHRAYDREWANAHWRAIVSMRPVFEEFRSRFAGKCSPVHFFWGAFDLAVTRFSGRRNPAPPEGVIEREAYSHEVISHGFWPGGIGGVDDAAFYAYAKPEPEGLGAAPVEPAEALYNKDMSEFILPYEAVRAAASPERALMSFLESTYREAANRARWDRRALERA